ncbi:BrxA family protein [Vibrio cholerae]
MKDLIEKMSVQDYNTAIKDIAGLKDYTLVFNIISAYFFEPNLTDSKITDENEFDIRTSKTRNKVSWAINKAIIKFINQDHELLIKKIYLSDAPLIDKKFCFLWHLCLNNRLFREITTQVFSKVYFTGRAQISQDDIIAFLKDKMSSEGPDFPQWSEDTLYRVATKYLSLMTKFDFVTAGRVKSFNHIRPTPEALVLFVYFSNLFSPEIKNIFEHELLPTSFIAKEDIQDRFKKLSMKGFFDMSFNGVALNVELTHNYKDICDALYS